MIYGKTISISLLCTVTMLAVSHAQSPIICDGMQVGTLQFSTQVSTDGPFLSGKFTATLDTDGDNLPSLAEAAAKCGEHHFNFYQVIRTDSSPPVDSSGNALSPPYLDTPPGGYGGASQLWDDRLPWYWTEGPRPPAATPGYKPDEDLRANVIDLDQNGKPEILEFSDAPGGPDGTNVTFELWLASVNDDGSLHGIHEGGVQWTFSNPTTPGVNDRSDWTVQIDQSFAGVPNPLEVETLILEYDNRLKHAEITTVQSIGQTAYPAFPLSFETSDTAPAQFHSFYAPHLTTNGQLMYSARVTTGSLDDVPFDTADSIWTTQVQPTPYTVAPSVSTPQSQVTYGDTAPLDAWQGNIPPDDVATPRFVGTRANRITAWGIDRNRRVVFQGSRAGFNDQNDADPQNDTSFEQSDRGILWEAMGGSPQLSLFVGQDEVLDFELMTDSGAVAVVVPNGDQQRLVVPGVAFIDQNDVPDTMGFHFADGFGFDGNYSYSSDAGSLIFQTAVASDDGDPSKGFFGIYRINALVREKVAADGDVIDLGNGVNATLTRFKTALGNGYQPQATPDGAAAFIADFSVDGTNETGLFVGTNVGDVSALARSGDVTKVLLFGKPTDVKLSLFDDLLVGPDGTIYFEAEAEIREPPFLFETYNFIFAIDESGMPRALVRQGDVPETIDGSPFDLELSNSFGLRDANSLGQLVFTSKLERTGLVNNGNDDLLLVFDPNSPIGDRPALIMLARQNDPIPGRINEQFQIPNALRDWAISENGHVAFASGEDDVMLARLLTNRATGDLNGDGFVDVNDIETMVAQPLPQTGNNGLDLNMDGLLNIGDLRLLVTVELNTYMGDANLDGEFNSTDFVKVLADGEYEDAVEDNSTWSTGDWDGDGDFTSSDLVEALQDGGYNQGKREGVASVPEPSGITSVSLALLTIVLRRRPRMTVEPAQRQSTA